MLNLRKFKFGKYLYDHHSCNSYDNHKTLKHSAHRLGGGINYEYVEGNNIKS